jgi:hypothetical protein
MSELPGRPNIDQLRRQARELLRAAADGEPAALARVRAFSERVSLSAAQLAVAREYGFASWPALHAEVERRLAELPPGEGEAGRAEAGWSFGGGSPIETVAGRDTETTLTKQGEQLDKTLKAQSEQLDRTLAEQRTRTLNERFDTVAEQLGSDKPPAVRLAAVYAMAGLADDWQDTGRCLTCCALPACRTNLGPAMMPLWRSGWPSRPAARSATPSSGHHRTSNGTALVSGVA